MNRKYRYYYEIYMGKDPWYYRRKDGTHIYEFYVEDIWDEAFPWTLDITKLTEIPEGELMLELL